MSLRVLDHADGPALHALAASCPIEADFVLSFTRGVDFFAWPARVWERWRYAGAEVDGRLVGACMAGVATGQTAAGIAPWFYLGDARVHPDYRGQKLVHQLVDYLVDRAWPDVVEGFGIVKTANRAGERTAALLCGHPLFVGQPLDALHVALVPLFGGFRGDPSVEVRVATPADIEAVAALHNAVHAGRRFAPVLDADAIQARLGLPGLGPLYVATRGGRLVGALAVWDMNEFHGSRVLRYAASALPIRLAVGALRWARPQVLPLPAPGGALQVLSTTMVAAHDPGALRALLGRAAHDAVGRYHLLSAAFVGADPLLAALKRVPYQRLSSTIFHSVRRGAQPRDMGRPYVDVAWI